MNYIASKNDTDVAHYTFNTHQLILEILAEMLLRKTHSVLWHCSLGRRKGIQPVKNWLVGCWHGHLSAVRCRFAYGPAYAIATHYVLLL